MSVLDCLNRTTPFWLDTEPRPTGAVTQVACDCQSPGIWPTNRRYPQYALVLTLRGLGRYRNDSGEQQPLPPGSCVVVLPDVPHSYGPAPGKRWDQLFVCFQSSQMTGWQKAGWLTPDRPVLEAAPVDYWADRMVALAEGPPSLTAVGLDAARRFALLELLILDLLLLQSQRETPEADARFLAKAKQALGTDLERAVSYPELARDLGVSYESFRKRFARLAGSSPGQYRQRAIMHAAIRLILRENPTNAQLADHFGFCSEAYFSRQFKRVTGWTPRHFREQRRARPGKLAK